MQGSHEDEQCRGRTRMCSAGVARTKRKVVVIGTVQIALADCGGQGILLVVSSS